MLTVKQAYWVLLTLYFFSRGALLPIQVDLDRGKIQLQTSTWRLLWWKFWLSTTCVRSIQSAVYGTYIYCYPKERFAYHDLPIFFMIVIGTTLIQLGMYTVFIQRPEVTMTIFNEQLSTIGDGLPKLTFKFLPILKRGSLILVAAINPKSKLSVYEKISLSLPVQLILVSVALTLVAAMNPQVFLMVPNDFCKLNWQNTHAGLIALIFKSVLFSLSFLLFTCFIILVFLQNCKEWTGDRLRELKK